MRAVIVLALVSASCMSDYPAEPDFAPFGQDCQQDTDCDAPGVFVCARDLKCRAVEDVRTVHVQWTVNGDAASALTCGPDSGLDLVLDDNTFTHQLEFGPLPCEEGLFTIENLPRFFIRAALGPEASDVSKDFPRPISSDGRIGFDVIF